MASALVSGPWADSCLLTLREDSADHRDSEAASLSKVVALLGSIGEALSAGVPGEVETEGNTALVPGGWIRGQIRFQGEKVQMLREKGSHKETA